MYQASREFESEIEPRFVLGAVWDVASYPEFVKGVKQVEVESDDGARAMAWFTAGLVGLEFRYLLELERSEDEVCWQRVAGAFKDSAGSMRHLGQGRFRYENALDPGFAVPEMAVRMVLERSLPRLIDQFLARARALQQAHRAAS